MTEQELKILALMTKLKASRERSMRYYGYLKFFVETVTAYDRDRLDTQYIVKEHAKEYFQKVIARIDAQTRKCGMPIVEAIDPTVSEPETEDTEP